MLNESYARRQRDLKLDISLTIGAYTEASAHIEKQRLKDLQKIRQAMYEAISNPLAEMQSIGFNASAQASLSPKEFQQWQLGNEHQSGYSQLADSFLLSQKAISENELISETERYAQLQSIYETYLQNKSELSALYAKQEQDLVQSQHDAQMGIWQDLLTRTGTIFNDMAAMVKETSGESSAAYKAMFLVNQGISMAQALINTEVAATKAMAEGGMIAGIPMAAAIRALGYASVGMIAAQTITGMAHNGIDNIPKEGTWLLDGGERVLNPQQNKDLTNYLASQPQQSSSSGTQGLTIINQIEQDDLVGKYMQGPAGRQIFINQIKASPSEFKRALGVS